MNIDIATLTAAVIKIFVLLGLGVYGVFAVVMARQEQLMARVLDETFEPALRFLVYLHLAAAVGVFLLAIVLL